MPVDLATLEIPAAPPGVDAVTALSCYLLLLVAIPSSLVVGAFGAAGPPATLFSVALLCWYLVARAHPALRRHPMRQPLRAGAFALCCSVLATYSWVNRAAMSPLAVNGADRGLIMVAGWLGVLLLAADGVDRPGRLAVLVRRIVFAATATAAIGIVEFGTGVDVAKFIAIPGLTVHEQFTDLMTRSGLARAMGTASQPLEFSAMLAMSLPLAIHQARHADAALRTRRWLQTAVIAGAIPMAVSRSAIMSLAMVCVMLVPTWPKPQRGRACALLLGCPLVAWLAAPGVLASFASVFGQLGSDTSSTSRTSALAAAIPLIGQHLWLGQGFQTFFPQTAFFVDDQFLTSLIETGIVGLAAVLVLFASGWRALGQVRRATRGSQAADLAWCLAASLAVAAVSFATFDVLSFPLAAGVFFLILGCAGALWRLECAAPRPAAASRPASAPSPAAAPRPASRTIFS